jgi:GNAT superfamily N-acetyltransferase
MPKAITAAPPRTDTSPESLREAIEADMVATRLIGGELPLDARFDPDASWVIGPPGDPFRSVVVSTHFSGADADRRIAEIVATFDAVPTAFLWWRAPFHTPGDLGARLEAAAVFTVGEAPAMAVDLAALVIPPEPPAGLEIRPVTDLDGLRTYIAVIAQEPPPDGAPPLYTPEIVARIEAQFDPGRELVPLRYVGWLDGRPVATSRLSLAGGTAGIYNVETLPDARGRGVGAAVTLAPLLAARELGYRIGTLQSSDLGHGVYRRLGFEEVFRYTIHVHLPGGARFDFGAPP